MGTLSNDFITIEYSTEIGRETARYYIELFNEEPDYFKGILNGLDILHASRLPLPVCNEYGNRSNIIKHILGLNDAKCTLFCSTMPPTQKGVYYGILSCIHNDPCLVDTKFIYHDLAYDYMRMTGDFSYLKKYYYEGIITQEDLDYICGYKIENCYNELLKEKINDTKSRPIYPKIIDNMDDIDKAIKYTDVLSDEIIEESKRNNRIVSVPRIGKRKFEELVIGTLAYIDPTNNMVEEYLKLKKAGKIDLIHGKRNISSEYTEERNSFGNIINCSIKVYMKGDLTDVGALVHEFGHYYYRKYDEDVRKNNDLFGEFPSIYLEFKTFEYLGKIYTNRQVKSTCAFRMKSNNSIIGQLLPSLYCIKQHINTEEYHLDEVKEYAEKFVPKDYAKAIEKASPRKRKKLVDRTVFINKARTLNKLDDDVESIKYIIGTYFAMNSIRNLKHEDVLRKLEYMQYHKVDFTQMKMLLKMIETNDVSMPKQKQVQ